MRIKARLVVLDDVRHQLAHIERNGRKRDLQRLMVKKSETLVEAMENKPSSDDAMHGIDDPAVISSHSIGCDRYPQTHCIVPSRTVQDDTVYKVLCKVRPF
jgi:hypothetical protein